MHLKACLPEIVSFWGILLGTEARHLASTLQMTVREGPHIFCIGDSPYLANYENKLLGLRFIGRLVDEVTGLYIFETTFL